VLGSAEEPPAGLGRARPPNGFCWTQVKNEATIWLIFQELGLIP